MASKSRKRKGSRRKKRAVEQNLMLDEIVIWGTLAVSILILISNFGFGGFVGDTISDWLYYLFGWGSYLIPFLLFGIVAFLISNRKNFRAGVKAAASVVLFLLLCALLELIVDQGGKSGKLLTGLLAPAVGVAGTYVITIVLSIICIVIITGKSIWKMIQVQSGKAYARVKEERVQQKEASDKRRKIQPKEQVPAEKPKKRKDRLVSGVSRNTELAAGKLPGLSELLLDKNKSGETENSQESDLVINRSAPGNAKDEQEKTAVSQETKRTSGRKKAGTKAIESETAHVENEILASEEKISQKYVFPPLSLLKQGKKGGGDTDAYLRETAAKLQQTLRNFGVNVTVTNVSCGPSVTRYELQPEQGVKVSRIVGLSDDIKLNLAAADIRIEAPIPGKAAVGIEVPNRENQTVMLRDLLETKEFQRSASKLSFAAGRDIAGNVVVADIAKMPHLLVAGATGSGKSVCINTLIMSILYKSSPDEVKLIMVDPKVVELSVYNGIPHLLIPVVTDPKKAAGALNWAVAEMNRRYQLFAEHNVRDIKGYNDAIKSAPPKEDGEPLKPLPQIVIIVDELADLMMVAPGEVEEAICRLAQLARAAGLHLVLATQRPSVNVITGLIKANMPSRIAFSVSSGVDSRTIIDMNGAEKLLGKGDMLFYPAGYQKPARVQGAFVSDHEVQSVVDYLKEQNSSMIYDEEVLTHVNSSAAAAAAAASEQSKDSQMDVYFEEAGRFIIEKQKASIGMLQRVYKIGFNRAARIMDQLCEAGVVGGEEGTRPRKILMTIDDFEQYLKQLNDEGKKGL